MAAQLGNRYRHDVWNGGKDRVIIPTKNASSDLTAMETSVVLEVRANCRAATSFDAASYGNHRESGRGPVGGGKRGRGSEFVTRTYREQGKAAAPLSCNAYSKRRGDFGFHEEGKVSLTWLVGPRLPSSAAMISSATSKVYRKTLIFEAFPSTMCSASTHSAI